MLCRFDAGFMPPTPDWHRLFTAAARRTGGMEDPMPSPDPAPALPGRPTRPHPAPRPAAEAGTRLLDAVAATPADRVLVVGGGTADLLCASIRRGCRAATGVAAAPLHPEPAEVVLAPAVATLAQAEAIAACACRALRHGAPGGRLAIRLLGAEAGAARALCLRLVALGYAAVRRRPGGVVTGQLSLALR